MLHKILTSCMLKSTQGMIVTFLVVMNKSIPPRIFFQLLPRFPLTCAKNPVYYYCCAGVAQLVEQLIRNQQVAGSSPASSSKGRDNLCLLFFSETHFKIQYAKRGAYSKELTASAQKKTAMP